MRPSRAVLLGLALVLPTAGILVFALRSSTGAVPHAPIDRPVRSPARPDAASHTPAGRPLPSPAGPVPRSADGALGPLPVARAFAIAEWTSDGTSGLHALAARTVQWTTAQLRSEWATAPDPPAPSAASATAQILDATIVDPRAAPVVVQVDVERWWTGSGVPVVDSVPHVLLLTMAFEEGAWKVDDVAAVN
jgi:hypothetical protein